MKQEFLLCSLQPLPPQFSYLGRTFVKVETNNVFLCLSPAEHPCRKHLPCRPVWVGHVGEGEFTREVCLEAVLRAWPGRGVCHYYCVQYPGTAELASEDICLQVLSCHLLVWLWGVFVLHGYLHQWILEQLTWCRRFCLKLVLMACTHSVHLNNILCLCLSIFSCWV